MRLIRYMSRRLEARAPGDNAAPATTPVRKRAVTRKDPSALSEHDNQCLLFAWANVAAGRQPELSLLYAVPNYARVSPRWGAWMKAEGKRAGVPDIHLPVPRGNYTSLYIELKVARNKESDAQMLWRRKLNDAGNLAVVCWSWIEAREAIESYLAQPAVQPIPERG
jgi:hypothetical protein